MWGRKLLILLEFFSLYFLPYFSDNNSMEKRNEIKVGDVVKSLDFVGVNDCFYIGLVTDIFYDGTFRAKMIKRVWQGQLDNRKRSTDIFIAPLPGESFFDDMAEEKGLAPRIQVLA